MEAIIYFLIITVVLTLGAAVNYRRAVLKNSEALRLRKEAGETLDKAQQEYKAAVQARLDAEQAHREAGQAKDEAIRMLENVNQYWKSHRLN